MWRRQSRGRVWQVMAVAVLGLVGAGMLGVEPASAASPAQVDTSLRLVPEDAAFYSAMLRNREQFEAIANSRAWAKIKQMPLVQMAWNLYLMQATVPGSVPARIQNALRDPDARKTFDVVADMLSDEVFCFGDRHFMDAVAILQEVGNAVRYGSLVAKVGGGDELSDQQLQMRAVLTALVKRMDALVVPDLVMGFKLRDAQRAKDQLAQLEEIATPRSSGPS